MVYIYLWKSCDYCVILHFQCSGILCTAIFGRKKLTFRFFCKYDIEIISIGQQDSFGIYDVAMGKKLKFFAIFCKSDIEMVSIDQQDPFEFIM